MNRYLRVNFKDTNFRVCVDIGCQSVMKSICSSDAVQIKSFEIAVEKYGLEKIRKSIVNSSYSAYLLNNASRLHNIDSFEIQSYERILTYLNNKIEISLENEISVDDDWNNECCYVDFVNYTTYVL